jgi:hypoxanthine-DNA glycosylase
MLTSFKPIINSETLLLILGTAPGVESLKKSEYYANATNQLRQILYSVFCTKPESDYNSRIEFLMRNKIALWDVIKQCDRLGSLDKNIHNEQANVFLLIFDVP